MLKNGTLGLVISGILAVAGAAAGQTGAPGFIETLNGFERPALADTSAPVANMKLSSGRFTCTLTTGRASYVMVGPDAVGIYFDGGGTMEYESTDSMEAPSSPLSRTRRPA